MQQEFEQPETTRSSTPSQSTSALLAQGDALAQLAALENHLAVLRQELVARDAAPVNLMTDKSADASANTTGNERLAAEESSKAAEMESRLREEEFKRREDESNRRIAELERRELALKQREEVLRRREEGCQTPGDVPLAPDAEPAAPVSTNESLPSETASDQTGSDEAESDKSITNEAPHGGDEDPDYSGYLENLLRKQRKEPPSSSREALTQGESTESSKNTAATPVLQTATPQSAESSRGALKSGEPQKPKTGSPVDLAAILRKQGFSVEGDESSADVSVKSPVREPRKVGKKLGLAEHANSGGGSETAEGPVVVKSGGDEESIDDYMSKLLARVRGGDAPGAPAIAAGPGQSAGPTPSAKKASQKAAAIAATKAAKAALAPEPAPMIVQGELAPRTVAPEKNININAIRELANMSATSALNSHQQKKTAINSQAKLLVTLVSFTLGVALMIVWRLPHSSPYSPYWALAAFAVSAIWGVQFAKLFSQQLVERAARLDRHLKRTSEAVCTTTSEATVATEAETAAASS